MVPKTEEEWLERFKDMLETESGSSLFDNSGADLETIRTSDERRVWSVVEGDDGRYMLPGFHVVNNVGYVLSEEPITDEELASGEWNETVLDAIEEPAATLRP